MRKSKLNELLQAQLKAEFDYHLYEFLEEKFDPEYLYNTYLQNSLPKGVNIPGKLFTAADALAGDWNHKGWAKVVTAARTHIKGLIELNALERMYKSEEFLAYHKAQGGTMDTPANMPADEGENDKKAPPVIRAAKQLRIQNVELLRKYIAALNKFGPPTIRPVAEKMLRAEKSKLKVDTLNEFLYEGGFAKRMKGPEAEPLQAQTPEIKLNKKALQVCGFQNLKGDKPLDRIRAFILAMHRKDKTTAEVIFGKIMKDEPLNSLLNGDKLIDIFKRMQKRKAFETIQ
ncbi:hypothetical protein [uncultured Tateyamaria sp.]|uniref:hypothetical protein n=1 Tax=uncultured Tateyamaria sp. TaxID=455651 RepID=UPI00260E45AE|nr:hypothetical protein [uncultured Tateyamaria sp.]